MHSAKSSALSCASAAIAVAVAVVLSPTSADAQDQPADAAAPEAPAEPNSAASAQPGATDSFVPSLSTVLHVPPSEATGGEELRIVAVVDAAWIESSLVVRYRHSGDAADYAEVPFERSSAGGYFATIPPTAVSRPGVEYYIVGQKQRGPEVTHFASAQAPHRVIVAPTQSERWAEQERARLNGRVSTVTAELMGHDFGNRFGHADRFLRADLDFTHRLIGALYSISLGYGFIEGETPSGEEEFAVAELQGARYGYAGLRLRLHQSVWIDTRASIGVSRDEFIVGGRAVLTLGKPWRSNVDLGAEILEELGTSLWVRLQWDTVQPLIMGATIMKTDIPAATLTGGAYVAYDVGYPVTPRITVRGSVTFGSRDGPGRFGGSLGTQLWF